MRGDVHPLAGNPRDAVAELRVGAVIAGAQKCGTTSLAAVLAGHPDVCLANGKEAHLFDRADVQRDGVPSEELERCFSHRKPGQLLLDATPSYLYLPGCIEGLLRHNPDMRIIVALRPPVLRAVSHYHHERRHGREHRGLLWALLAERFRLTHDEDALAPNSAHRVASYVDRGRYDVQLRHLMNLTQSVHVVLLDDLIHSPGTVLSEVFGFLGLSGTPPDDLPHLNQGTDDAHRAGLLFASLLLSRSSRLTERMLGLTPGALR